MAKINTTNYQPITAWNGTQDLLIVEQPDGTKVATPEQVKQFVEAGDFESTGEIIDGHGNILAKKADITTVTIPAFTPSEAGWRRICKIKQTSGNSAGGMIYVGGSWSNRQPASASIAVNIMQSRASLTLLSSANIDALMTSMRLVYVSGNEYWLDIYFPSYSNVQGPNRLTFTGDIAVSDIQNPISITTDSTAATDEISLNQNVSGTVLTDKRASIVGNFTIDTTQHPNAENNIIVRQFGKVVSINGYILRANLPNSGTSYILGALSNVSNPPVYIRTLGTIADAAYNNGDIVYLSVGTEGRIAIKTRSSVGSSKAVFFSVTYIAN